MARKKHDPYLSQAQAEAQLKFDPQLRTLSGLLADSRATTKSDVTSARAQGAAMEQYIRSSTPQLEGIYTRAGQDQKGLTDFLAHALPATGGGLAQNAISRELSGAAQRLSGQRQRSVSEYAQRGQDALSGALLAQRQAKSAGRADSRKIEDQIVAASGDKGLYVASRYGDLLDARRQRALTKRGQDITSSNAKASRGIQRDSLAERTRHDKAAEKTAAAKAKAKAKGQKWSTPQQQGSASDSIAAALVHAKRLKDSGNTRPETAQTLLAGRAAQKVKDGGTTLTVPAVPKTKQLFASVALDIAYDGRISRRNVQELHRRRIKVKELGLPTQGVKQADGVVQAVKGIL